MIYVRMMDLQALLLDMHSKVTCIQRPALDDFERAVEKLPRYAMANIGPLSGTPAKVCKHPAIFEGRCVVCNKDYSEVIK